MYENPALTAGDGKAFSGEGTSSQGLFKENPVKPGETYYEKSENFVGIKI